jgi:hypothetical protein
MAELHQPHTAHPAHRTDNPEVHHEESDVNIRGILAFGAALIVSAVVIHFGVWVLFKFFDAREQHQPAAEYPLAVTQENRLPPEPRLQTNPRQDLADLRAREERTLKSYSWVDKNSGVVRIPIDEAIKKTLERGLPARQGQKP